jgi:hypothetical protein
MVEESMRFLTSVWDGGIRRGALALAAVLLATAAPAETLRVTAANSVGNLVYDVTSFVPPGTISPLNTDGASHGSFSSLVLVPNVPKGTVDVLVTDITNDQIIRYTPALGATAATTTLVWSRKNCGTGPTSPDGLSVDSAGNLYFVSTQSAQLWVLPASATSATGYASTPLLVSAAFSGGYGVVRLRETAVAASSTGAWHLGDVLLLVGNKNSTSNQNTNNDAVYLYRAATISQVLNGAGPVSAPDEVLISGTQFPNKEYGLGMDFWPADALDANPTLLILTTAGRILRYDFTTNAGVVVPNLVQVFASGLGGGLGKLKAGLQLETPYAYVTQSLAGNAGQILQFGAPTTPGTNNLIGTATQGVMSPDGLAVEPLGAVTAISCESVSGCDISGGVIPHKLLTTGAQPTGNVIEATCVVLKDPRVNASGMCDGTTLNVGTLCPGFGNEIIPGTLCGGSGVSKAGFALVRTNAAGVNGIPGILVTSEANVDKILPPATGQANLPCPSNTYSWAPFSDASPSEGGVVNIDPATGLAELAEMTSFCGTSGGSNRGMSVYGVGLALNTNALTGGLVGDAQSKYNDLSSTVAAANIVPATRTSVNACLSNINSYLSQGDYVCAANEAAQCDTLVGQDPSPATNYPGNAANPNPWGEIRGRLGNLYLALNTRVSGNPPNSAWPLTSPPTACAVPVVTLSVTPTSIAPGSAAQLSWSTQHALSCQASGGWAGPQPLSGVQSTGTLASTTTFTLTCTGANSTPTSTSVVVTVLPPPTISAFSASPAQVVSGGATQLSWTASNAQSCSLVGGSLNLSGATSPVSTGPITQSTTYVLTCNNGLPGNTAGSSATAQLTVAVAVAPTVTLTANPTTISEKYNKGTTLSWSSTNATSCVASGAWSGPKPLSGSASTGQINATKTYVLTCSGPGGSASASVTVRYTCKDR